MQHRITLTEAAHRCGFSRSSAHRRLVRGCFGPARFDKGQWWINADAVDFYQRYAPSKVWHRRLRASLFGWMRKPLSPEVQRYYDQLPEPWVELWAEDQGIIERASKRSERRPRT